MTLFVPLFDVFRYFLRVLSDLLLGVALKDILVHVGALMKVITKVKIASHSTILLPSPKSGR